MNLLNFKVTVNETYIQVPVKENKNSLYIKFSNLELSKVSKTDQNASFNQILLFVAKSISQ
jgi:DNA-dependent RNA polymerase auxiliary subunit epsilon